MDSTNPLKIDRNLGEQPIVRLMAQQELTARDLVNASPSPMTFKMVSRACKGRRLTPRAQLKVLTALNCAANSQYRLEDCFTYT